MDADAELRTYYARRAAEYERVYDKPERKVDLARLREELPLRFRGTALLEIACGTGYWTPHLATEAASVLAIDAAEETLAIARAKRYPRGNVRFELADAYALPAWPRAFDGCFAGFWWSHVPRARLDGFLAGLHARLAPGARVVFLDNRYVEGSSSTLAGADAEGNTYQLRQLADGSEHRVLKNFPTAEEMAARLEPWGAAARWDLLEYYWTAEYRLP
jgi:SAM-dependent methyltransferase